MYENNTQHEQSFIKRNKGALVAIIFGLLTIFGSIFIIYINTYAQADEIAIQIINNSETVDITVDDALITFQPLNSKVETGIIFYPGGKVEPYAYAPLMQELAKEGYLVTIYQMPYNLAIFKTNAADKVLEQYPEIKSWYIGGHSLGGAMASSYASKNAEKLLGYFALAAYPSSDLSDQPIKMLSIHGTEDEILNYKNYEKYRINAPENTEYLEIQGGNHAYFGNYGTQKGDGVATISREEQQTQTIKYLLDFFNK